MKKEEVKKRIEKMLEKIKGIRSPDEYYYGFRDGCYNLLDWLVEQGIVESA